MPSRETRAAACGREMGGRHARGCERHVAFRIYAPSPSPWPSSSACVGGGTRSSGWCAISASAPVRRPPSASRVRSSTWCGEPPRSAEMGSRDPPRSAEIRRNEGRGRGSTSRKSSRDWLSRPSKAYGRDVAEMWPKCSRDTAEIQPRCSPDTTEIQPKHHLRGRRRPRRGRAAAAGISRIISARSRLDLVEGLVEDEQLRRREQAVDNHRLSRLARRHGEERPVAQLVEPELPEELARLGGTPLRTPLRGGMLRHTMPAPRAKSKGCAEYTRVRVFSRAACARAVRLLRVCCPTSRLARLASRDGRLECGEAGVVCVRVVRDREAARVSPPWECTPQTYLACGDASPGPSERWRP